MTISSLRSRRPNADLPAQLSAYGLIIAPAGTEEQTWNEPGLGTGPYRLNRFNPGVRSEVELNIELSASDSPWVGAVDAAQLVQEAARPRQNQARSPIRPSPA